MRFLQRPNGLAPSETSRVPRRLGWAGGWAVLLAAATLFPSCASIRAGVRDMRNTDFVGQAAPALDAEGEAEWVGGEPIVEGDWYLVAFVKPT